MTRLTLYALKHIFSDAPLERLGELMQLLDRIRDQPSALDMLEVILRYYVQGTERLDERQVHQLLLEQAPGDETLDPKKRRDYINELRKKFQSR